MTSNKECKQNLNLPTTCRMTFCRINGSLVDNKDSKMNMTKFESYKVGSIQPYTGSLENYSANSYLAIIVQCF